MSKTKLFGTSGIRGKYGEKITESLAEELGKAVGTYVATEEVIVGSDPRISGPSLKKALFSKLTQHKNVIDLELAPTPVVAFACNLLSKNGIVITASHNPKEYNGFKVLNEEMILITQTTKELQSIMSNYVGIVRSNRQLD